MLTTLSILSRDQGPTWREPDVEDTKTPEVAPGRVKDLLQALVARLAAVRPRRAPSRSRA